MAPGTNIHQIAVTDVPAKAGGTVRLIELNRPEKLNCLSLEMLNALLAALRGGEIPSCVVLTGAGRSFCTGLDFREIGGPEDATNDSTKKHLQLLVEIFRWFLTAKIPTVVLARGYAAGGGAGLVACAKTAVVSTDFRCKLPGGNLARLATVAVTLFNFRSGGIFKSEADWLGREFDASAAKGMGLVDKVVSPEQLDDAIRAVKDGSLPPELIGPKKRNKHEVAKALTELEHFLQSISRCKPD
jgi:enoyl-CoA hydratase/carnithine racemase